MVRKNKRLPSHLLVLRTSAMGDVAMLPHALRALTDAYPGLRITVATRPMFRPFFAGLDVGFLDVDTKGAHHSLAGMWRLAAEARRMGVDAVADVHSVMRSHAFDLSMRLHGVPVAVIDKGRGEKKRFIRDNHICGYRNNDNGGSSRKGNDNGSGIVGEQRNGQNVPGGECVGAWLKHTVVRYCDVFRKLGFVFADPEPVARTVHPNPMGEKTGIWVGFAPFSAHAGKTYPEPLREEAVGLLAGRYERVFIHSGGGDEVEFAQRMELRYPNVTALFGRVKFAGELDLIANLDCVVSMDSLVMHLASLTGTPVVSVWGATHPGLGFLGYGCDKDDILQADIECRPCSVFGNKPCRYGDYRCLKAITPDMVAERVARVVGR